MRIKFISLLLFMFCSLFVLKTVWADNEENLQNVDITHEFAYLYPRSLQDQSFNTVLNQIEKVQESKEIQEVAETQIQTENISVKPLVEKTKLGIVEEKNDKEFGIMSSDAIPFPVTNEPTEDKGVYEEEFETVVESKDNSKQVVKNSSVTAVNALSDKEQVQIEKKIKEKIEKAQEKSSTPTLTTSGKSGVENKEKSDSEKGIVEVKESESTAEGFSASTTTTQNSVSKTSDFKTEPMSVTDEEFEVLAKIIHAEAGGEPYEGKVAVGAVIVNRVNSKVFPNNIKDVVFAKKQFSPVSDGSYARAVPTESDYMAAREALSGKDPTEGALYFYAPSMVYSAFHESLHKTVKIGGHQFSKP